MINTMTIFDKREAISEQNFLVIQEQLKTMLLRLWCDCQMVVSARGVPKEKLAFEELVWSCI